ncbi:kininogen-1 [Artibeus jamaicensis]|uniref:kininogen-1 n=1 Tax=Artibeus jamaicensis TaxID=9417 RepID=UPI00235ACD34|nr:kininogen-1 [Artibeus jamaicensis]
MKLIAILLLCSRLLPSLTQKYHWEEIDCNDEDVFKAVDSALKEYNSGSKSGNQFVLYRVTEVNKTDDQETFYSIKYQIKEGDCPVQSDKTWQDCDYKEAEQAATGECTAIVGERANNLSVATQTCQITPAKGPVVTSQYDCLGCVHPLSTASPGLEPVLRHAIQHYNNHSHHSHLFALKEVKQAHRQVVAGWKYEVTYSIEQTNCSKENFLFLTPDCKFLLNGDTAECTDHAYMDLQLRISSFSQKCNLHSGVDSEVRCLGCPSKIPVDSPQLQGPLKHSITKLNAENNGTFYFKIDTVKRATAQVVAGMKYSIEFTAKETTCSKESNKELTEDCEINLLGEILSCTAEVYEVLWLNKTESTIKCRPLQKALVLRRPPGFSPFRSVLQVDPTKEVTTLSPPHTFMAPEQDEEQDSEKEQGHMRERGWGREKKIKHGLGLVLRHKHEHNQGHGHQRGHGLGHGHQPQHVNGHGHQREHDYNLEYQGRHGLGHGHQQEHGLARGHKHDHGNSHTKHKNKRKNNGKDNDMGTRHWASSSEDSTTSTQTHEKTGRSTPLPSPAQPGVVTFSDFQDLDLIAATMTNNIPPTPTLTDDAWIPEIHIQPKSLSFNLIPDFPETSSPKCPGRPWKPLSGVNPTVEITDFHDFDLSGALY